MEIREYRSSESILKGLKQKLEEIKDICKSYYKRDLSIYRYYADYEAFNLAEVDMCETKLFGRVIYTNKEHRNILRAQFESSNNRRLSVHVYDSVIYPIIKEEITKFAEEYNEDIKSVNFIKNF